MPKNMLLTAAAGLVVGALVAAPVAIGRDGSISAAGRDDVRVGGTCTASSTSKLKLSPEDGKVEVEFEVDENRVGKVWNVTVRRNGTQVVSRSARTRGPSGSFEVRAVVSAGSPKTNVVAVARRRGTGEVCRATATL
jgi:hypothetical protein